MKKKNNFLKEHWKEGIFPTAIIFAIFIIFLASTIQEPHFTITKEECWNETNTIYDNLEEETKILETNFLYKDKGYNLPLRVRPYQTIDIKDEIFQTYWSDKIEPFYSDIEFLKSDGVQVEDMVYLNNLIVLKTINNKPLEEKEVCEQVEVDDEEWMSEEICFEYNCGTYMIGRFKKELTIEWLSSNCEILEQECWFVFEGKETGYWNASGTTEIIYHCPEGENCLVQECEKPTKYLCNDYTVEVWNQIK